jgi:hypothetical protein
MRDLISCGTTAAGAVVPKGLSFEISDLVHARDWATFNNLHMSIRLDHGAEDEEYEEVIEFQAAAGSLSKWIIWRNAEAVFVQPLLGRRSKYASVIDALERLFPKRCHT